MPNCVEVTFDKYNQMIQDLMGCKRDIVNGPNYALIKPRFRNVSKKWTNLFRTKLLFMPKTLLLDSII